MSEENLENIIKLKSAEGIVVPTTLKCALMSSMVRIVRFSTRNLLLIVGILPQIKEMQDLLSPDSNTEIPLEKVDTATLKRIVKWLDKW